MDKQRAKLKAKRREARQKEKQQIVDNFKQDLVKQGVKLRPGTSDEDILRAHKRVEEGMFKDAIGISIISMVMALHSKYQWGNNKIWELVPKISRITSAIGSETRSLTQLIDEFTSATKIDYADILQSRFEAVKAERNIEITSDAQAELIAGVLYRLQFISIIPIYVMYFYYEWGNIKLKNLITATSDYIVDVLLGSISKDFEFEHLQSYIAELNKSCGLEFNRFGTVVNTRRAS